VLLAGNGASRAVSERFHYDSLFGEAALSDDNRALFEELGTANFEEVLRTLRTTRFVVEQLHWDPDPLENRYQEVRQALVTAVNQHHVAWVALGAARLDAIRAALLVYEAIYTTNYDLLFYWAINHGDADPFLDHFWHAGNSFDPADSPVWGDRRPVHWLHGGLQIYRVGTEGTAKRTNTTQPLLEQFATDGQLPLYVAEGSADEKRRAIRRSDYLSYCFDQFRDDDRALVVFGQSLFDTDQHLVDAIRANAGRPVAYGVHRSTQEQDAFTCARIRATLAGLDVVFFDSTTHPLGDSALNVFEN
jgi:hypothetical protein